jgi:hypothetical protein
VPVGQTRSARTLAWHRGAGGATGSGFGFVREALRYRIDQVRPPGDQTGSLLLEVGLANREPPRLVVEPPYFLVDHRELRRDRIVGPTAGSTPFRLVGDAAADGARIGLHANTMPCRLPCTKQATYVAPARSC